MTYKAVGRSIINYPAPVWSPNLHDANYIKIQYTERSSEDRHWLSLDRHLTQKLKVKEHTELLSAPYLDRCLEPDNVCHSITTKVTPKRQMKEILFTRHLNTGEPMMIANNGKTTLHADAVNKDVKSHENNVVLDGRPPPISNSEKELTRKERWILWTPGLLHEHHQEGCKPQRLR